MVADHLSVVTLAAARHTLLCPCGEIDMMTAPQFATALDAIDPTVSVVVDMAQVDFMDSTGLTVLLASHQLRTESGATLRVRNPSAAVHRLLEVSYLLDLFEVRDGRRAEATSS